MPQKLAYQAPAISPSILRHLMANFYDLLLMLALFCLVTGLFIAVKTGLTTTTPIFESILTNSEIHTLQLLLLLSSYAFYMYFWLYHGRTLGMQTWQLKLVNKDQTSINFIPANIRFFSAIISYTCLGLGLLWKLVDKHHLTWHDHLSKTMLVHITTEKT